MDVYINAFYVAYIITTKQNYHSFVVQLNFNDVHDFPCMCIM